MPSDELVNAYDYLEAVGFSETAILAVIFRMLPRVVECDVQSLRNHAAELGLTWATVATFNVGPNYRNRN